MDRKHVLFVTLGSLGDLYPYLALATEMQRRGYRATIATCSQHRLRVERSGVLFRPVAPDLDFNDPIFQKRALDERKGGRYLLRDTIFPQIRASYEDVLEASRDADLLVTHVLTFAGPLVAEKTGIPWVSTVLAPLSFFSYLDPPVLAAPLTGLRESAPWLNVLINRIARFSTRGWSRPVRQFRKELALPEGGDPIFDGQHSPARVLALFSGILAKRQSDWPRQAIVTGFPFWQENVGSSADAAAWEEFLAAGPAPVVFTLGSSAVMDPGRFYGESVAAARKLKRRAILVGGVAPTGALRSDDDVLTLAYAPHAELFSKACACVHPGGIGTTARALQAGCPMLVVPFAHDQPDNAARLVRLGVACTISRGAYRADRAAEALGALLGDPRYREKSEQVAREIRAEDGVGAACSVLATCLAAG